MIDGLWTLEFRSSIGNTGYGTVTLNGGNATGGTAGYYYIGTYTNEDGVLAASLRVIRFNEQVVSVFGPLKDFDLQLSGTVAESRMVLAGRVSGNQDLKIVVVCVKRDAAPG
jgi:hypothetical protein